MSVFTPQNAKTVKFDSVASAAQITHIEPKTSLKLIYGNSDQADGIT